MWSANGRVLYIRTMADSADATGGWYSGGTTRGTPQGGVVSPVLANLFLHYAFDVWMTQTLSQAFPGAGMPMMGWCTVRTEQEAQALQAALDARFAAVRLGMHPDKDQDRVLQGRKSQGKYPQTQFDFLGYTFRPRMVKNRKRNSLFVNFTPAVSTAARHSHAADDTASATFATGQT